MKITNVIKALEKTGLSVDKKIHVDFKDGRFIYFYVCETKSYVASWYEQTHDNGDIDSVYIRPIDQYDDHQSDYFAGSFYDTIKSVVKKMSK